MKTLNTQVKPNAMLIEMLKGAGVAFDVTVTGAVGVKLGGVELEFGTDGELISASENSNKQAA